VEVFYLLNDIQLVFSVLNYENARSKGVLLQVAEKVVADVCKVDALAV